VGGELGEREGGRGRAKMAVRGGVCKSEPNCEDQDGAEFQDEQRIAEKSNGHRNKKTDRKIDRKTETETQTEIQRGRHFQGPSTMARLTVRL
jgi:hypothetical protein